MELTEWARTMAGEYLAPLGRRWMHSEGVARQAERLESLVSGDDREVLVAAAYLHDVGYAPALVDTGFHPIDGARHLLRCGQDRLAGLVGYHSGALEEAELRGLVAELASSARSTRWWRTSSPTATCRPARRDSG